MKKLMNLLFVKLINNYFAIGVKFTIVLIMDC